MSGKIQRYGTSVAMPLSKTANQLKFLVNQEMGQIDMNSSYLEVELRLYDSVGTELPNYSNVTLGHDNIMYNPTCIVRDAKLYGTRSGKKYQDLMYINVLMQNLEYWTQGKNEVKSNTLWNGMGSKSQDGQVYSIFNNSYSDTNPTLRIPLKSLFPGSIGNADMFPADEDLSFIFFLEPFYRLFQNLAASDYEAPVQAEALELPAGVAFTSGGQAQSVLTASALGTVASYAQNQYITVGDNVFKITAVTADANPNAGTITLDGQVAAGACTVTALYPANMLETAGTRACSNISTDGDVTQVTFTTPAEAPAVGQTVSVTYFQYTAGGTLEADFLQLQGEKINYTVTASNSVTGVITLNNKITTLTNNSLMYGVTVDVLSGSNLDNYDWNILDSHLVLYRRNVPMASNKNMLVSNFESFNIQMVGGINKFEYSFPVNKSCYNAYALLPTATNLYSQAQNMQLYQFSVNNKPFTTIYMDLTTSLHNDNMVRALDNSLYYQPKNLNQDRDDDEAPNPTSIDPVLIPCKLYQSMMKGSPVVNEAGTVNLKLEMLASTGQTTTPGTVYLYCEKYEEI